MRREQAVLELFMYVRMVSAEKQNSDSREERTEGTLPREDQYVVAHKRCVFKTSLFSVVCELLLTYWYVQ